MVINFGKKSEFKNPNSCFLRICLIDIISETEGDIFFAISNSKLSVNDD